MSPGAYLQGTATLARGLRARTWTDRMRPMATKKRDGGGDRAGRLAVAVAAAGVGLITGLAARASARGVAQAAEPLQGHWLDIAKIDHLTIVDLLERARDTGAKAKARRTTLFGRIKDAFSRHALWEETVIYPALRFYDQSDAASTVCAGHADLKAALFDLERTPVGDPEWRPKLLNFLRDFEAQARREEEELFPALRRAITPEEDVRLTSLVNQQNRRFV
jgi:hypothetical protein